MSNDMSGFYSKPMDERWALVAERIGVSVDDLRTALAMGGLDVVTADGLIENVVGTYALPFAVATNFRVDGRDVLVPMVVEEPSVVAAASNAAKMVRAGGGFTTVSNPPRMIGQIEIRDVDDYYRARDAVMSHRSRLIDIANSVIPGLVDRGGGAVSVNTFYIGYRGMVVHLVVDVRDAMGANAVNTAVEAVAPEICALVGGRPGLRILSNLAVHRMVNVEARIPAGALSSGSMSGETVRDAIVEASYFAEENVFRATTHNKGVMNGVDAVVVATGNDWRAVEAGAHAYAAITGGYKPLTKWRTAGSGDLHGTLCMPMQVGIVGGFQGVHRGAAMALKISGAKSATELGAIAASAGLASNLAALRALSTDGIQRGHMALHARSLAVRAGAVGAQVDEIAQRIVEQGVITMDAARNAMALLRPANQGSEED